MVMMLLSVDFMTCSEESARKKMREPFDRRFYLLPREESWMSPFEELWNGWLLVVSLWSYPLLPSWWFMFCCLAATLCVPNCANNSVDDALFWPDLHVFTVLVWLHAGIDELIRWSLSCQKLFPIFAHRAHLNHVVKQRHRRKKSSSCGLKSRENLPPLREPYYDSTLAVQEISQPAHNA